MAQSKLAAFASTLTPAQRAELLAALQADAAASAPAAPHASDHIGPSGKPDGRKYACVCGKMFRSDGLKPGATGGLAWHKAHACKGA